MALQVLQFVVTIPPGTTDAAPFSEELELDNWDIERVDLEVPAGPAGLMGFAVYNNGVQWQPATPGTWLVWDDTKDSWTLQNQPNASGWSVVGYNLGQYAHAVTVRFHVNLTAANTSPPTPPTITIVSTPVALESLTS